MKKWGFLAFLFSSMAFGTSIRPVALESVDMPLFLNRFDSTAKIIRVARDGEVFGGTCGVRVVFGRPRPDGVTPPHPVQIDYSDCDWTTVTYLSRHEIRQMDRRIALARLGAIQYPNPGGVHCLAVPSRSLHMTAGNGSVLLKSGTYPCGAQTTNTSLAARKLVEQLQELRAEYERIVE